MDLSNDYIRMYNLDLLEPRGVQEMKLTGVGYIKASSAKKLQTITTTKFTKDRILILNPLLNLENHELPRTEYTPEIIRSISTIRCVYKCFIHSIVIQNLVYNDQ